MRSKQVCTLTIVQRPILTRIILLAYTFMFAAQATAAEIATLEVEFQGFDLDAGTVIDPSPEDVIVPAGADIRLAYNADRIPHAVVFPFGDGIEMSFVASAGFDGVSLADISNLVFTTEPTNLPFSPQHCVVIRTDQGVVFKLGNAAESGSSVTFNYATL